MARCFKNGTDEEGRQLWGPHSFGKDGIERLLLESSDRAIGTQFRDHWIVPIYFDDEWYERLRAYKEVGVHLYPRLTDSYANDVAHHLEVGTTPVCAIILRELIQGCIPTVSEVKVVDSLPTT